MTGPYRSLSRALAWREEGQDLAEYALLIGLIALLAILGVTSIALIVGGQYNVIMDRLLAVL